MLIARRLRTSNIAEYILYMWQVEDTIRATGFSMEKLKEIIIDPYDLDAETRSEMLSWYQQLIDLMKQEKLEEKGHSRLLINLVNDLHALHISLLSNAEESEYRSLYEAAAPHIRQLESRSRHSYLHETDTCLHGLYGLLLLKLQKKPVQPATLESFGYISKLVAKLAARYREEDET